MKRNRLILLFIFPLLFVSCKKENSGKDMTDLLKGKWNLKSYETTLSTGDKNGNSNVQTDNLPYQYLSFDGPDSASLRLTVPYFIGSSSASDGGEWNPPGADVSIKDGRIQTREPIYYRKYYYQVAGNHLLLKENKTFNPSAWVEKWGNPATGIVDSLADYYPKLRKDIDWWDISVDENSLKLQQEISYSGKDSFRSKVIMVFSRD
ncbi:hypothetical protein [Sphingobacterium zeae]|uniref:Lipocalin-like domain-containing protein n=1 Tax=Sphingobacterium zeae TaxID=1776859 RepID=A0ABU0U000_9SPHI|nr:hypothetical protein [Sphingobacterium zeae]MDQ1148285.1 hypothetical protein [Sphingobacterium zeae]